ncbi:MAG: hypothetical protein OIF55_15505 [Amphritea sp.]|nr:hypothetical protein [Amphritea sp.]
MSTMMPLEKFQQIRHVDEVVEMASDSFWVYRRTIGFNGAMSATARVVFFGRSREQVEAWMATQ